jgi:hypothetical protein
MSVQSDPPGEPRFLTTLEAATYLRISIRTLEKCRYLGGGPRFRKFGRIVRYTTADLDEWTKARSFEMTSDYEHARQGGPRNK